MNITSRIPYVQRAVSNKIIHKVSKNRYSIISKNKYSLFLQLLASLRWVSCRPRHPLRHGDVRRQTRGAQALNDARLVGLGLVLAQFEFA
jgi:hypothetical protein